MTQEQHADNFVGNYQGKYIDEDSAYGSQCWDLVARYAREEYGCPSFPTVSGGAEGLFRFFADPIPQYFIKVAPGDLQKGDIVVYGADFYPPWGHTALVFERNGNTILVLEQDGSYDPNHDDIADGVSYLTSRSLNKVAGGLRPKGTNSMEHPNSGDVTNIVGELWGRAPNDVDIAGFTAGNWHDFIYGVLGNYPYQDRKKMFAQALDDVQRLTKERDNANGIAGIRSDNFQKLCDAFKVTRLPDEQQTTQNIIDIYNKLDHDHTITLAQNITLQGEITKLQNDLKEYKSGDNIIITKTGFTGLFDIIKQYFNKK